MWNRFRDNFSAGIKKLSWFVSLLSERIRIEISIIKLLHRSDEMEKRRNELLRTIGERVYDLKDHTEKHILKDREIADMINRIDSLDKEIKDVREKASEIGKVE